MSYYYIWLLFLTKTKNYYIMSQYIINRSTKLCVSRVCVCHQLGFRRWRTEGFKIDP